MRIKLFFTVLILILSLSVQSKNKESNSDLSPDLNAPMMISRAEIVEFAKNFIGVPYRFASSSPVKGFDCSGFVNYVFKKHNISVPRASAAFARVGKALKPEEFKVGDILIFYGYKDKTRVGHVGIICEAAGMKSKFIHASSGSEHSVTVSNLSSKMYTHRFYKCIDVID